MLQYNNMHATLRFGSMTNNRQNRPLPDLRNQQNVTSFIPTCLHRTKTQKANINI